MGARMSAPPLTASEPSLKNGLNPECGTQTGKSVWVWGTGRVGVRREKVGAELGDEIELGDRREKVGADRLRGHMMAHPPRPAPAPCPARGRRRGGFKSDSAPRLVGQ